MHFIVMHRTDERWEAGTPPGPELISAVGSMIGEMVRAGVFVSGEGLRASSQGVRLSFTGGKRRIMKGPFKTSDVVPSGFLVLRVPSIDEAIDWSTRFGQVLGDAQIELRPITEAWDIGMAPRPAELTTQRFMALVKDPENEAGASLSPEREAARAHLIERMKESGVLTAMVAMQPTASGARFRRDGDRYAVTDGPFAESKELIAGYVILDVPSRQRAVEWTHRYAAVVDSEEMDLRELA